MQVTEKHPGKMWEVDNSNKATPFLNQLNQNPPTHDRPTQFLQKLWIQNASMEVIKLKTIIDTNSISGRAVLAFEMPGFEGFDINNEFDFEFLEYLISKNDKIIDKSFEHAFKFNDLA
jgi:CMP-N-acetylneuraminic acid synthetase